MAGRNFGGGGGSRGGRFRKRRDFGEERRFVQAAPWTPKTELGKRVMSGAISSMEQIFAAGLQVREYEIIDKLLPGLRSEIIFFGGSPGKGGGIARTSTRRTSRMHRSGRRYKISALVAVGAPGWMGIAKATSREHAIAIDKALKLAKLNIIPIRRGCGSWQCTCNEAHSIPIKVIGKSGSVTITLMPAPKGVGLAVGDEVKKMMTLAGIRDIWSKVQGQSRSRFNFVLAVFDAFKELNATRAELPEAKLSADEAAAKAAADAKAAEAVEKQKAAEEAKNIAKEKEGASEGKAVTEEGGKA